MRALVALCVLSVCLARPVAAAVFPSPEQIAALENYLAPSLPEPVEHYRRYYRPDNPRIAYSGLVPAGILRMGLTALFVRLAPDESSTAQIVRGESLPLLQGDGCYLELVVRCTSAGAWLPTGEQIARLEASLTLPYRAGNAAQYERYYAGITDENGMRRIEAAYRLRPNESERPVGAYIVSDAQLPRDYFTDLGCTLLTARFDAGNFKLMDSSCGALPRPAP